MRATFLVPFISYKYLLVQLTLREIKARYKQSFIGYMWIILNPLSQLLVYSFVFSIVFTSPTNNVPYVLFLYAALLPWIFTQTTVTSATQSLVENAGLLRKVSFPREVIPYSIVLSKIIDLLFSIVVFSIFMIVFNTQFASTTWLVIPIFLIQLFLTTGIALLLSACNLFYRDIQYLANLLIMLWMYMTPIVYPLSLVPDKYIWFYKLNPMVGIMEGYRSAIFNYPFETTIIYWSAFISIVFFVFTFIVFKRLERSFADIA